MRDGFVGWAASCSICCRISVICPWSDLVTVIVWYVAYVWLFMACVLIPWSWSDHMIVRVAETLSMSAKAEYMCLDLLPHVLICLCLGWFERCERVCVCAVCNWCVIGVCSVLWYIDYFTGFYNISKVRIRNYIHNPDILYLVTKVPKRKLWGTSFPTSYSCICYRHAIPLSQTPNDVRNQQ